MAQIWGRPSGHYPPRQWCPGNPKQPPYIVNPFIDWDCSVCHTSYPANYGMGNVTSQGMPITIWDGDDPPIEAITIRQCRRSASCAPSGRREQRQEGHPSG